MTSSLSIVQGTNTKPVSSQALVNFFAQSKNMDGELFIGYPVISSPQGRYPIDALWISPKKGIIVFDLIEGIELSDFADRQDDNANKVEARLKTYRELVKRRKLIIPIHTLSFAPGIPDISKSIGEDIEEGYEIANTVTIEHSLEAFGWDDYNIEGYQKALSALQSISTIRRRKGDRITIKEDSRGSKLKKLEDSIATLDNLQSKAVIETVEGVQRIRGLAGSGKTIVLALKAAYLHAQHPSWNIAVTFNTRSLKAQFRSLIYRFSVEQTGEEPDWSRIKVLNAWGAPGGEERDGLYHQFCKIHNASYFDFRTARSQFGKSNPFEMACSQAISSLDYTHSTEHSYNVILVDEAQDLPFSFLRLCYEFLDDKKRLVYAYDELQRLSEMSLAPPEEIFGRDSEGKPRVQFTEPLAGQPRPDIILEKCYRNSRPVLITAHALGFGIYRKSPLSQQIGLIQMFDNSTLWKDIGYEVSGGKLQDGLKVTLRRKPEASPDFLENHSNLEDLIQFLPFENELQQNEWLANSIERNLKEDELLPEDIIVINPDPLTTRKKVGEIRHILMQKGIRSHLAGVDTDPDVFFQTGSSITFTGIFRAKGNEAGMVYIINSQDCNSASQSLNLANIRNRLFTAITRSKAWIRVLGVGSGMINLIEEFKELEQNNFELSFQYPTKEERMRLSIVHRDTTVEEQKIINRRTKNLKDLIADVKSGRLYPEDIDEEDREQLIEILMSGKSQ